MNVLFLEANYHNQNFLVILTEVDFARLAGAANSCRFYFFLSDVFTIGKRVGVLECGYFYVCESKKIGV